MFRTTLLTLMLPLLVCCSTGDTKTKTESPKQDETAQPPIKVGPVIKPIAAHETPERVLELPEGWSAANYSKIAISKTLPDWLLPDTKGKIRRFSEFRGKKVLLINFASW